MYPTNADLNKEKARLHNTLDSINYTTEFLRNSVRPELIKNKYKHLQVELENAVFQENSEKIHSEILNACQLIQSDSLECVSFKQDNCEKLNTYQKTEFEGSFNFQEILKEFMMIVQKLAQIESMASLTNADPLEKTDTAWFAELGEFHKSLKVRSLLEKVENFAEKLRFHENNQEFEIVTSFLTAFNWNSVINSLTKIQGGFLRMSFLRMSFLG